MPKAYDFKLDTPFEEYPKEIHDVLLYGTGGREVKVHYKSQRGEGVYDVAFEGLIENVNRRYKGDFSEQSRRSMRPICGLPPARPVRAEAEEGVPGRYGGRAEYLPSHQHVHSPVQGFPGGAEADSYAGDHRRHNC